MIAAIIDTETTKLISNSLRPLDDQPRIIEFYGCLTDDDGDVKEELEFLCNPGPGETISPEIEKITRITNEMVADQKPFYRFAEDVRAFLGRADAVVAHNLFFDYSVIDWQARRCGTKIDWPLTRICTVTNTEWLLGHRLKLGDLHEYLFGERFAEAHRAKNDVMALKRCYVELRKRGML